MAASPHPNTQNSLKENIFSEQGRLNTFSRWPHSAAVEPAALAKAGFYYLGQGDRVRCAFCLGTLKNWQHGDHPLAEHGKHFGHCRFIRGENVGNIPLEARSGTEAHQLPETHKNAVPSKGEDRGPAVGGGGIRLNPRHPDYQSVSSREASFAGWPPDAVHRPPALVEAGFFFIGSGDGVRCFCCDGALRNWEPDDEPWEEHARWFPRCPYLLQQKGAAFVREVQAQNARTPTQAPVAVREELSSEDPLMMSEVARQALEMDFDRDMVLAALRQHTASSGGQLPSLDVLINTLLGENDQHFTGSAAPPLRPESSFELLPVSGTASTERQEEGGSDRTLCKICMDREVAVTFLPCGHLVCCSECAKHVKQCPVCRKSVRASIRTYLC